MSTEDVVDADAEVDNKNVDLPVGSYLNHQGSPSDGIESEEIEEKEGRISGKKTRNRGGSGREGEGKRGKRRIAPLGLPRVLSGQRGSQKDEQRPSH